MNFSIIISKNDMAGVNIRENLLKCDFRQHASFRGNEAFALNAGENQAVLYSLDTDTIFTENLDDDIKADIFIFATRHQSRSGERTLSVHIPGNYGAADFGGMEKSLSMSAPLLMKKAFSLLSETKLPGYSVTLESTHHGPFLKTPAFFIEIGSNEPEWKDPAAGRALADVIMELILTYDAPNQKKIRTARCAIGFGGTHYCSAFNKIEKDTEVAMSHICPKYAMENIDEDMVKKMISMTDRSVDFALLDWNGLNGEEKSRLKSIFEKIGLQYMKTKEIPSVND